MSGSLPDFARAESGEDVPRQNVPITQIASPPIPQLQADIQAIRDLDLKESIESLRKSRSFWHWISNCAESLAQFCFVSSPVLNICALKFDDTNVQAASAIVGVFGIGLDRLARYGASNAKKRSQSVNEFLRDQHVRELPIPANRTFRVVESDSR